MNRDSGGFDTPQPCQDYYKAEGQLDFFQDDKPILTVKDKLIIACFVVVVLFLIGMGVYALVGG